MRCKFLAVWVVCCASALIAGPGCGQTTAPLAAEKPKAEAVAGEAAETQPEAEKVLRQMADYLAELPAFSCLAEMKVHIQAKGMDNNSITKVVVRLERPNRLALMIESGSTGVTIVSDGKQITQYFSSLNRYAVSEAPADFSGIGESEAGAMLGAAAGFLPSSGEEFYKSLTRGVTGSEYIGTEKVGDVLCHRCKFLQEGSSWEIWIEAGDRPVPHKVVPDLSQRLAGRGGMADAKIEYVVTFSDWDVAPKFTEDDFKFEPPAGAEKVDSLFEGLGGGDEGPHPLLGQEAPAFDTVDLEGKPIDLKAHLGKDVVLLDFWATWCGPCIQAMPEIDAVAEKFADQGLVFYGVNVGEDVATIKQFLEANELEVPVAMDEAGKISGLYGVEGIPQTVLIGKDGKVQVVHVGFGPNLSDELTSEVEDLLAGKDLASEVLAAAEEAKKERAAREEKEESSDAVPGEAETSNGEAASGDESGEPKDVADEE